MSYISDLKLLIKFRNVSLYEEVSTTTLFTRGDSFGPTILPGGGYAMSNTQYLIGEGPGTKGYATDISNAMTIGFWLNPVNPGMATNPSTGAADAITMPVINFNNVGSYDVPIVDIREETTVDGENKLVVSFNDGDYVAKSEAYTPELWHYFWIVYDEVSLSIHVDGKPHALDESGALPATIDGASLDLYINHSLEGYAYNVAKNYGYISDIFVMNVANTSEVDIQRVINDGIDYLVDDIYSSWYIEKSSIYFNDPDTIKVTSSVDDMSYVYIGRNDGKILRGSPLLWETRRTLANNGESDLLGYYLLKRNLGQSMPMEKHGA